MTKPTPLLLALGLLSACGAASRPDAGPPVTWHQDVFPIVQVRCLMCHETGGIAPVSLDTYAGAQSHAGKMAAHTKNRVMPVWKPDPACGGPFVGERILTQAEIDTFQAWAAQGAPEGNPADAPPASDAGTSKGLPHVDATIAMTEPYTPRAELKDDYRCFLVDPRLTASQFVTGYDITPGVRQEVHHVILYAADRVKAQEKDLSEAGPGWTCFGDAAVKNAMPIGAWAPGMPAVLYPAGTGIQLLATQVLAMQVHYNMDAKVREPDLTTAKLMFSTRPVTAAYLVPILDDEFSIPPHVEHYTPPTHPRAFKNTMGFEWKVWGFLPHLHQLGERITVKGPGDACLVDIPQWDFHWQQQYFRKQPFLVPDGQSLTLSCTWTNDTDRTVTWGEGTSDEMCLAFIYATP